MNHAARVRPAVAALIVTVFVAGMSVPARADAPGAPGPDPSLYTPPFELAHPVDGAPRFSDTFGAIRDRGDRLHHGIDIGAPIETPVLATASGVVSRIGTSKTAGLFIEIRHTGGWRTRYLHLNDQAPPQPEDSPEEVEPASEEDSDGEAATGDEPAENDTEDEPAGGDGDSTEHVPAGWGIPDGIDVGAEVTTGDVVGYVGFSGNASSRSPHLHFELRMPDHTAVNPSPFLTGIADATTLYVVPDITDEPITRNIDVVGHVDPGDGFVGAVEVYADVAYLGTYGSGGACPATGVRRYEVSDPEAPTELDPISDQYPGTWTPAIWVGRVTTPSFSGTLAVVAHRACATGATDHFGGLALYDVTDPAHPVALGAYDAGRATSGVGDLDVWVEDRRVLVGAVVPNSLLDHSEGLGDVRIINITDPKAPVDVADWDFRRAISGEISPTDDGAREIRAEGITFDTDSRRAFIAQWDGGVVALDLTAPHRPEMVRWHPSEEHPEGNAAATAFDADRQLLTVFYTDFDPLEDKHGAPDWGMTALLDTDLSVISAYSLDDAAPDAEGRIPLQGIYTPLNGTIFGQRLYVAWASGGLRIVDLHNPDQPFEIASFVPPTRVDPQRQLSAPNGNIAMPFVSSIHVANGQLFITDLNTGLWIVKLIEPPPSIE